MATSYATYVYNSRPNYEEIMTDDIFTGNILPRHKPKDIHMWGCPIYVIDNMLQQGHKLPKWQLRSHHGIFFGLSPNSSSDINLILNSDTGHISPPFHGIFDNNFSTLLSLSPKKDHPSFWSEFDIDDFLYSGG